MLESIQLRGSHAFSFFFLSYFALLKDLLDLSDKLWALYTDSFLGNTQRICDGGESHPLDLILCHIWDLTDLLIQLAYFYLLSLKSCISPLSGPDFGFSWKKIFKDGFRCIIDESYLFIYTRVVKYTWDKTYHPNYFQAGSYRVLGAFSLLCSHLESLLLLLVFRSLSL